MPYQIKAVVDGRMPGNCQDFHNVIIFGKSDARFPPHALTQTEYEAGMRCRCVVVEMEKT